MPPAYTPDIAAPTPPAVASAARAMLRICYGLLIVIGPVLVPVGTLRATESGRPGYYFTSAAGAVGLLAGLWVLFLSPALSAWGRLTAVGPRSRRLVRWARTGRRVGARIGMSIALVVLVAILDQLLRRAGQPGYQLPFAFLYLAAEAGQFIALCTLGAAAVGGLLSLPGRDRIPESSGPICAQGPAAPSVSQPN